MYDVGGKFMCNVCGATYLHKATCRRHFKEVHQVPTHEAKCSICLKLYKSQRTLKEHLRNFHYRKAMDPRTEWFGGSW